MISRRHANIRKCYPETLKASKSDFHEVYLLLLEGIHSVSCLVAKLRYAMNETTAHICSRYYDHFKRTSVFLFWFGELLIATNILSCPRRVNETISL